MDGSYLIQLVPDGYDQSPMDIRIGRLFKFGLQTRHILSKLEAEEVILLVLIRVNGVCQGMEGSLIGGVLNLLGQQGLVNLENDQVVFICKFISVLS